jgi:hypothetical protein
VRPHAGNPGFRFWFWFCGDFMTVNGGEKK